MKKLIKQLLRESFDSNLVLYHGGPFNFESFSTSFIGNGEGAQAFGWGLYFTDNIEIAKFYTNKLYSNIELDKINKKLSQLSSSMDKYRAGEYGKFTSPEGYELFNQYNELMMLRSKSIKKDNTLYAVSVTKPNPIWLEWERKLTEQQIGMIVKQASIEGLRIAKFIHPIKHDWIGIGMGRPQGEAFDSIAYNTERFYNFLYRESSNSGISDMKEASLFLHRAGFDGIKYSSDSLRIGGANIKGGYNYVLFDGGIIKVDSKINLADLK